MNALEKYFGNIDDLTGFDPSILKDVSSVMAAVNWMPGDGLAGSMDRNDPTAWMAYAGTAIKQSWSALPDEVRDQMLDAINEVVNLALEGADKISNALGAAAVAANAAPIIGQIIAAVIAVIKIVVDAKMGLAANARSISKDHKAARMTVTFESYPDPRDWVFKSMKLANYTQYVGSRKQGNWSRQPCFRRAGLGTNRMFSKHSGVPDKGKCGHKKGVKMYCKSKRKFGYEDCNRYWKRKSKNPPSYCERHLAISSLFYPYWSPAYAAGPIANSFLGTDSDPNSILIGQQTMLLTDPHSNMRVMSEWLLNWTDNFVNWWRKAMDMFAVDGKKALLRIDGDGNAPGTNKADRWTVDDKMDPDYTGSDSLKNRFYFDEDGRILPYAGMEDNGVNDWGIRAAGGSGAGTDGGALGVTVGAYNAVIVNTMAFFTARSNMLRNGNRMKGLLMDHKLSDFDPKVRDALKYAADKGGMLPGPSRLKKARMVMKLKSVTNKHSGPGGPGAIPVKKMTIAVPLEKPPRFSLQSVSISDGPGGDKSTGSSSKKKKSKMPLLIGAAAVGFIALKKK